MLTRLFVLLSRLRALSGSRAQDEDFDAEVAAHIELLTEEHIRRGMPPGEARRLAILRFGGPVQIKEQQHDNRGLPFVETTLHDARYALRTFGRSPGFTALAILTLGLAIGVNTTVFTLFNAVALRGLPVHDSGNLFRLARSFEGGSKGDIQYAFSYDEYLDYRSSSRSFTGLIAASWPIRVVHGNENLEGQLVSGDYFTDLGTRAAIGRTLLAGDAAARAPVVVLSDPCWRQHFNADPNIAGKAVRLNETLVTIAGVAPAGFIGTGNPPQVPDFWAPLALQPQLLPGANWLQSGGTRRIQILARLAPHATRASAGAELTRLASHSDTESGFQRTIAVIPEPATLFGSTSDARFLAFVAVIMTVVGLVVLIACANLSNMLLARAASRQREIGVRLALGASRSRLVRQFLTESVLLAAGGGAAGLLLSVWSCAWLWASVAETVQRFFRAEVPFQLTLTPDVRVFAFTLLTSLAAGMAFGLWPALQFSSPSVTAALKADVRAFGTSLSRSWLRGRLIGGQVAVSLALLVTAGLLARGAARSQDVDPGFAAKQVFAVTFARGADRGARLLREQVFERLRSSDELAGASYVERVPLRGTWTTPVADAEAPDSRTLTLANHVSASYFATMGIAIERGRTFATPESSAVAVVSQSTARRFWPNADPIGRRLKVSTTSQGRAPELREVAVVGVARDVHTANASRPDPLFVYLPADSAEPLEMLVRTVGAGGPAMGAIRAAVGSVDRQLLPSLRIISLDSLVREQQQLTGTLAAGAMLLAALALVLALIGIYGVTSFLVAQRVQEIGIRLALGARRGDVARLMLADGLRPVAAGGVAGLILGAGVSLVARATLIAPSSPDLLFGVGALDPATFLAVCSVLGFTALLACLAPAIRAMRVDPMTALRAE